MSDLGARYVRSPETSCRKSRSGAKKMCLGPDKLTVSKLDNMKLRKITETIRSKLNSSIQI
jgi:hypothetical protein